MEESTKENMLTIRNKDKAHLHGQMDDNIVVNGITVNSMGKVY